MSVGGLDPFVSRLRDGDHAAWESFYDSISGDLRGYLARLGARDPDDLLGETMVQVVRDIGRFTGTSDELRPWTFRIARNRLIDAARKRKRRPIETVLDDGDLPVSVGAGGNPDPEDLSALLSSLTPDQREAVWLRYVLDLSLTDAATVMGKAPEAVAALTHRAMERLRRTFGAP
ncbi:MAG: RNA polymerase sigma factor [Actinomycetota bacterium]